MQPGAPQQPQQHITRRYLTDAQYTADAARMATAGWRVSALSRDVATNQIIADYVAPSTPRPPLPPLDRRMFFLGAGLGGVLLLLLLLAVVVAQLHAAAGSPSNALLSPTTTVNTAATLLAQDATAASSSSSSSPGSTITPMPALVSGPRLGGPLSAFDAAYGPEVSQGFWNTTLDGQPVQLVIAGNRAGESADTTERAAVIDIDGPDSAHPWTAAQEAALVSAFLPPDARHINDVAGYGTLGPDHIYVSQQLATSFVASIFQDANDQQLGPGTFDWQCSTQRQFCEIGVGTNS